MATIFESTGARPRAEAEVVEPGTTPAATSATAGGPLGPRGRSGLARALGRQPVAALAVTGAVVLAGGVLLQAAPVAVVAVEAIAAVQLGRSTRPAGAPLTAALAATLRALLVPLAVVVVALHVLGAARSTMDDTLVLGAAAALVAGTAAVVRAHRSRPPRVLVIGDLPEVRGLVARWIDDRSVNVVGGLAVGTPCDVAESGLADLGTTSVGTLDDVVDYVTTHPTDLVVVAPGPATGADDVRRLSWALEHTGTRLACIGATEHVAPHRLDVEVIGGSTMALVARPGGAWFAAAVKQVADRTLAAVLAVAVLPLLALAVLAIRLDSPGPALFRQTRVGRDGRLFTVYKLRTMTVEAEEVKSQLVELDEGNGVLFKIRHDPRITRVGKLLRQTSVDELPQLLNVVRGDMSLVGPRPALPVEVAQYNELEQRRLAVKPGLTGLWQVSGRSSLSRERSMRLDASYADNWRPQGDLVLLLRTVEAVLSRRGAY